MLRIAIIYVLLSFLVVLFAHTMQWLLSYADWVYMSISHLVTPLFPVGRAALIICRLILLMGVPVLVAAIPALIYRLITGQMMPHFLSLVWILWLLIALRHFLVR